MPRTSSDDAAKKKGAKAQKQKKRAKDSASSSGGSDDGDDDSGDIKKQQRLRKTFFNVLRAMEVDIDEDQYNRILEKNPSKLDDLKKEVGHLQPAIKNSSPARNLYKFDVKGNQVHRMYTANHPNIRIPETTFTDDLTSSDVLSKYAATKIEKKMEPPALIYHLFEEGVIPRRHDLQAQCKVSSVYYADTQKQECHLLTSPRGKKLLGSCVLVKSQSQRNASSSTAKECSALWKNRENVLKILGMSSATQTEDKEAGDDVKPAKKTVVTNSEKKKTDKTDKSKKGGGGAAAKAKKSRASDDDESDDKEASKPRKKAETDKKKKKKKKSSSSSSEEEEVVAKKTKKKEVKKATDSSKKDKRKRSDSDDGDTTESKTVKTVKSTTTKKVKFTEPPAPVPTAEEKEASGTEVMDVIEDVVQPSIAPTSPKKSEASTTLVPVKPTPKSVQVKPVTSRDKEEFIKLSKWFDNEMMKYGSSNNNK